MDDTRLFTDTVLLCGSHRQSLENTLGKECNQNEVL